MAGIFSGWIFARVSPDGATFGASATLVDSMGLKLMGVSGSSAVELDAGFAAELTAAELTVTELDTGAVAELDNALELGTGAAGGISGSSKSSANSHAEKARRQMLKNL